MSFITNMFSSSASRFLFRGLFSGSTTRNAGRSLFEYFKPLPQSSGKMPKVRIVSYAEMQRISQKNFDRRIERIISEKFNE